MGDEYFGSVQLLLHCNGDNDAQVFTDSSTAARTVTVEGDVYTKTATKKFGSASASISNAVLSYLTTAQSPDLDMDSGDITVELWVYSSAGTVSTNRPLVTNTGSTITNYNLQINSPNHVYCSGKDFSLEGTTTVTTDAWHHVAFTKQGSVLRLFLDGNLEASYTMSVAPSAQRNNPQGFQIGAEWNYLRFDGYVDDVRITKGVARYTASFTPPSEEFADSLPPTIIDADIALPSLVAILGDDTFIGEMTLPALSVSAVAGASSAVSLPALSAGASCGGNSSLALPQLTTEARRGEDPSLSLPALTATSACGASAATSLPSLNATAAGHDATGERDAQIPLPSLTAAAVGGHYARATIPSLSAAATGTVPWIATSAATLPALTATVGARSSTVARAEPLLPALTAQGYSGAVCSVTVGALTLAASGTAGVAGAVTATLPLFVAVATGTIGNTASADITLPSMSMSTGWKAPISLPSMNLVAIGTAVVAVTYEAYALNLKHSNDKAHDELTRYTNFPFDRIVRYKDSYYGMNATGLYLLEGTTDDGDPIPWEVATHITDFGNPKIKTVQHAYFGGRLGPDATVTLSVGEQADNSYSYTTPRGQTVQNYRQVFGKGAKARYFSVGVAGEDEIELDSLELAVTELARRI